MIHLPRTPGKRRWKSAIVLRLGCISVVVLILLLVLVPFSHGDVIRCSTTKGDFDIKLNPKEAPQGVRVLKEMVRQGWFNEGGGVAFFRKNQVATQFGVKQRQYKFNWAALNLTSSQEWRDPSPESDRSKRPHWPRGTMYMVGSTHMVVVLQTSKHYQGKNNYEAIVGTISEQDMQQVFDRIYAYNDIIDNPRGGPGPDQTEIYLRGWDYLHNEFPHTDAITGCKLL